MPSSSDSMWMSLARLRRLDQDFVDQADHRGLLRDLAGIGAIGLEIVQNVHAAFLPVGLRHQVVDRLRATPSWALMSMANSSGERITGTTLKPVAAPTASMACKSKGFAVARYRVCSCRLSG